MKPINNFDTVQATTGEFKRPTPNGYICKITLADDYPFDANTGKGDYLKIEYDIASGEFKDYYTEQYNRFGEIQYVYPNLKTAAKANNLTMQKLLLKLNSWDDNSRIQFRYARDEDRPNITKVFFPLEQYKDGELVNRFTTLQEASAALGYSKSVIGRWTQTNDLDNFGCSWKRISQ